MIEIETNKSLKNYNTFGFDQSAQYYVEVSTDDQLSEVVEYAHTKSWPIFILGGGSNIVLTRNISGLVIRMVGTHIRRKLDPALGGEIISASAGKNWHELVLKTIDLDLQGLENLSLIPGTVGAAPVQNIGAYGVEVKDRIVRVHALHIQSGEWVDFNSENCIFSYRHSIFKDKPNQYAITEVDFSLGEHNALNTSYINLENHLSERGLSAASASEICQSVVAIRQSKLPDPALLGNVGSFFHNPIVTTEIAERLKQHFPGLVMFDAGPETVKLSAGWLIDQLGYKGFSRQGVGVYKHQALVLVHDGSSTGSSLMSLAEEIMARVYDKYKVRLSIEPVIT